MMYMLPTSSSMKHLPSWYGAMTAPDRWGHKPILEGRAWCMDNGVFTGKFSSGKFTAALEKLQPHAATCKFIAAPDVVGNFDATLSQYPKWREAIRSFGYPVAFVGQDGMTHIPDADALFIGGTTQWKLTSGHLIREAKRRGMWVHVGRVNSQQRIRRFALHGADSADGTHSAFAGLDLTVNKFNQALSETPLWRDA